ncbi:phosphomevalonate kinase [Corynebacterium sp.]|uniref:phosphomevalonate kinase n=1 Tax=Corynebacterium sp. TaxID=1720 RepID=UPI0026DB19EF|nr:phosphomevalonate kinase [Corynebacterium sp.]MDO4610028.1 phosphomevalonate kinase [Corynebacterium sp.]
MRATGLGCGKLYLAGEYAVMDPGGLAVIAGVDRYVEVAAAGASAPGPGEPPAGRVASAHYDEPRTYRVGPGGAVEAPGWGEPDLVLRALEVAHGVAAAAGAETRVLDLDIVSGLDDAETGRKYGLGSSGAVVVAVVDAVTRALGVPLDAMGRFRAAMSATVLAGAAGSGGDIACAAHGGVVAYRRPDPDALRARVLSDPVAAALEPWPDGEVRRIAVAPSVRLLVGWTGRPADTGDQLARAGRRTPDPGARRAFVASASGAAADLSDALEAGDATAVADAVLRARAALADHAADRGTVIETPQLTALADAAWACGAPGKSSGAGGGDCGIALDCGGADVAKLHARWRDAGVTPLDLAFDRRIAGRDG